MRHKCFFFSFMVCVAQRRCRTAQQVMGKHQNRTQARPWHQAMVSHKLWSLTNCGDMGADVVVVLAWETWGCQGACNCVCGGGGGGSMRLYLCWWWWWRRPVEVHMRAAVMMVVHVIWNDQGGSSLCRCKATDDPSKSCKVEAAGLRCPEKLMPQEPATERLVARMQTDRDGCCCKAGEPAVSTGRRL